MNRILCTTMIAASILLITGCQNKDDKGSSEDTGAMKGPTAAASISPAGAAATQPSWGQPMGKVTFTQEGKSVHVVADLSGLSEGKHGIHIHEKADVSAPDLMSTGPHFNPGHHAHGGPSTSPVHEGDMCNIIADTSGRAHLDLMLDDISVGSGAANDVVGRSVIVHAKADDLSGQPAGNSGPRIAGGVIQLVK